MHPDDAPTSISAAAFGSPSDHPKQMGPYRILQVLGEGGMGVVYLAEQTSPIFRRVVLKVLKLGMDTKQVVARFEAERQALAVMNHPGIARVHDAGATEANPLPDFREQRMRRQSMVDGLRHTEIDDLRNRAAVLECDEHVGRLEIAMNDAFLGTPAYMSPEQMEMSGLDIDTRSDIYTARVRVRLGNLLVGAQRFEEAEPILMAAVDAREKSLGRDHAATKAAGEDLAKLYDAWGRTEKVAEWRRRQ